MAFDYPVSLNVRGRRAVVVGGNGLAEGRAQALIDAGADVTVIAAAVGGRLAIGSLSGKVRFHYISQPSMKPQGATEVLAYGTAVLLEARRQA